MKLWSHLCWFCLAVVVAAVTASLVQTQFNLAAIRQLGVDIAPWDWLRTMFSDLVRFTPTMLAIQITTFLIALPFAYLLARYVLPRTKFFSMLIFTLSGGVGLFVALATVDALAPMPTLIAATRDTLGRLSLVACSALGAWIYAVGYVVHHPALASKPKPRASVTNVLLSAFMLGALSSSMIPAHAQSLEQLNDDLTWPWSLAFLPNGDMLITERSGTLKLLTPTGNGHFSVRADVRGLPEIYIAKQAGLMDVQLDPDFAENQRLFLSYACGSDQSNHTCLASAVLTQHAKEWHLAEVTEVFRARPSKYGSAHYGGRMVFLADKTLVLTLGDGFDFREHAQKLDTHLGKTVRLNRDGSAPSDNPFVREESALPEIFTLGHRNVQGIVTNASGDIFIHEHGPRGGDELNHLQAGNNYGWPIATFGLDYTGARVSPFELYDGMEAPLYQWTPSIAPAGMAFDGEKFWVAALAAKRIYSLQIDGSRTELNEYFADQNIRWRDIRQGPDGYLYILSDAEQGAVYRFRP